MGAVDLKRVVSTSANPERWFRRQRPGARLNTWAGVLAKTASRLWDRDYWSARRRVQRGIELPELTKVRGAIWAVTMVKDEADIIEHTIRHLFRQGIDQILLVDNGSSDGTLDILRRLSEEHPVHVGIDSEVGYFQDHKMTALARVARAHGALWVIPFDADEFWFAPNMSVREHLRRTDASVVTARMFNAFPTPDVPTLTGITGQLDVDMSSPIQEKIALRTHPLAWITMGNHSAVRPGFQRDGLRILHVPWRSRDQLVRKIRQGARAYSSSGISEGMGGHWRTQARRGPAALDDLWNSVLQRCAPESLGWRPHGPFVSCEPATWRSWDPQHAVDESTPRYKSWTDPASSEVTAA